MYFLKILKGYNAPKQDRKAFYTAVCRKIDARILCITNKLNDTYFQNILIYLFTRRDRLIDNEQFLSLLTLLGFSTSLLGS